MLAQYLQTSAANPARDQHQISIVFDHACGGYRYESAPDLFTLPSAFFTESELFALLMAEQLLEQAQPGC